MTATEALQKGLVDEILPHLTFEEDLTLRVTEFTAKIRQVSVLIIVLLWYLKADRAVMFLSLQNSLDMKKLARVSLRRELPTVLNMETKMLRKKWISEEFQSRAFDLWKTWDFQD